MGRHDRVPVPTEPPDDISGLPPVPDAQTGQPTPPHAPAYTGPRIPAQQREIWPFKKPEPPDGLGPVLAWYTEGVASSVVSYLVSVIILMIGTAIIGLFKGIPFYEPFEYWLVWLLIVVFAWFMASPLDFQTQSAGAHWFQWGYRKRWYRRKSLDGFIQFYDLTRIRGDGTGGKLYLYMEDMHGNRLVKMRNDLQFDQRIWDLLYNGILYSVANGADINQFAIELLHLDETPVPDLLRRENPEEE